MEKKSYFLICYTERCVCVCVIWIWLLLEEYSVKNQSQPNLQTCLTSFDMFELFLFTLTIWGVPLLTCGFIKNVGFFCQGSGHVTFSGLFVEAFKYFAPWILFWFGWWHTDGIDMPTLTGWKYENILSKMWNDSGYPAVINKSHFHDKNKYFVEMKS